MYYVFIAELEQNGYTAMYKQYKNKPQGEKPWYQVYTIKDYRKMKNEVRLTQAPLGPDLDNETYKEKVVPRLFAMSNIDYITCIKSEVKEFML